MAGLPSNVSVPYSGELAGVQATATNSSAHNPAAIAAVASQCRIDVVSTSRSHNVFIISSLQPGRFLLPASGN